MHKVFFVGSMVYGRSVWFCWRRLLGAFYGYGIGLPFHSFPTFFWFGLRWSPFYVEWMDGVVSGFGEHFVGRHFELFTCVHGRAWVDI